MTNSTKEESATKESVTPNLTQAENTGEQPMENPQLTVSDLQLLARIVDLASRRGAFQASELTQVGAAYNKLAAFLAFVDQSQNKDGESESGESKEEATAE